MASINLKADKATAFAWHLFEIFKVSQTFSPEEAESVRTYLQCAFIYGYEEAEKDIISLIESRISEILGDAQPKPALRAELQELIKHIKEEEK